MDIDKFIEDKINSKKGASSAGHHYIQLYNEDKWSFYLKYIRGLSPKYTKPPLIFGGVFHDAKEAFYLSGFNIEASIQVFKELLRARRKEYESLEEYTKDLERGPKMLFTWGNTYAQEDKETYEIVEVEGTHEFALANGMPVTVRWDLLAKDRHTGSYYLFDTKTTGFSVPATYNNVRGGDQVTMYIMGMKKVYPEMYKRLVGLIPDIIYKKGNVIRAERPGIVMRNERELIEYEQELIGLFNELSQKVEALEGGFKYPHMLFPRNGKNDSMFKSDWGDLYRAELPKNPFKAPPGYTVDSNIVMQSLSKWHDNWQGEENE